MYLSDNTKAPESVGGVNEAKVLGVPAEDIGLWWRQAKPLLEKAVVYADSKIDIDFILQELLDRNMQLWIYVDQHGNILLASITRIVVYLHNRKRLEVILASGEGSDDMVDVFQRMYEDFARMHGCEAMESIGRKGWKRRLKKYGYEQTHVT